ncbi:hypothetical protein [Methylobacterium gnaphalii]|uniref:Uncharacterized protein n=1 Tax=Methylobacterium gnaphalii TaxID=1010610 RepID=A0A512JNZ5_9HYPH|nr:hypothetical protein [Methylobacterium gnaphalii]GEP11676.1 hypothetical protein MGN01_35210 [Methylobacterium gnaphalii]GJD71347.1 hypothetical protein MMMDOFMJ_4303 [Methylobacterium gnaphalii]GLS50174.1 hypothetical protein GCM10007885_30260 [Methylobacterium gnaphalii]
MTIALAITDHALLRWMERAYGIDVDTWRRLCREEVERALSGFTGTNAPTGPAFIVSPDGRVLTFIDASQRIARPQQDAVAVAATSIGLNR